MAETQPHYDIFISYAKEDSEFARHLVDALRSKNISVWYDQGALRLGDSVLREIEDGLEHSEFFLLLLSPAYFERPWTQFETGVALGRAGKEKILPVFLRHFKREELARFAPSVADAVGIDADQHSPEEIAGLVSEALNKQKLGPSQHARSSH